MFYAIIGPLVVAVFTVVISYVKYRFKVVTDYRKYALSLYYELDELSLNAIHNYRVYTRNTNFDYYEDKIDFIQDRRLEYIECLPKEYKMFMMLHKCNARNLEYYKLRKDECVIDIDEINTSIDELRNELSKAITIGKVDLLKQHFFIVKKDMSI
jgi:hypothetical protein